MKKLFYNLILPVTFVALLLLSVVAVSQFRPFFAKQYDKLGTAEYIGIAQDDLMSVTDGLLSYMAGDRENLDMQYEVKGQLREILANKVIFGSDLCEIGLAERIEQMFVQELAGPGAVRATLRKYLA